MKKIFVLFFVSLFFVSNIPIHAEEVNNEVQVQSSEAEEDNDEIEVQSGESEAANNEVHVLNNQDEVIVDDTTRISRDKIKFSFIENKETEDKYLRIEVIDEFIGQVYIAEEKTVGDYSYEKIDNMLEFNSNEDGTVARYILSGYNARFIRAFYKIDDEFYYVDLEGDFELKLATKEDDKSKVLYDYFKIQEMGDDWYKKYDGDELDPKFTHCATLENGYVNTEDCKTANTVKDIVGLENLVWYEPFSSAMHFSFWAPFNEDIKVYEIKTLNNGKIEYQFVHINTKDYVETGGHDFAKITLTDDYYPAQTVNLEVTGYGYNGDVIEKNKIDIEAPELGPHVIDINVSKDKIDGEIHYSHDGYIAFVYPDGTYTTTYKGIQSKPIKYHPESKVVNEDDVLRLILINPINGVQTSVIYELSSFRVHNKQSYEALLEDISIINFTNYTESSIRNLENVMNKYQSSEEINYEEASKAIYYAMSNLSLKDNVTIDRGRQLDLSYLESTGNNDDEVLEETDDKAESEIDKHETDEEKDNSISHEKENTISDQQAELPATGKPTHNLLALVMLGIGVILKKKN